MVNLIFNHIFLIAGKDHMQLILCVVVSFFGNGFLIFGNMDLFEITIFNAIYESGTDALILITNRLDLHNEGDDVWIKNAEKLLAKLPKEAKLGLYECPHPYKRLVTPKILDWCLSTGRFYYMKDTCCDAQLIAQRVKQLEGSQFLLLNANCQTLLETMRSGAHGYCGIMCNFHPKLYAWLGKNYQSKKADYVQSVTGTFGFTEVGLPYPLTAKYHMNLCGIPTENIARNRKSEELTQYSKIGDKAFSRGSSGRSGCLCYQSSCHCGQSPGRVPIDSNSGGNQVNR